MHDSDCDVIFLDDLAERWGCKVKEVLSYGISGKIDIFAVINSDGTGFVDGMALDMPECCVRGNFSCVYQMGKNDLLSIRAKSDAGTLVSFRYQNGLGPDGEELGCAGVYDFQTELDGWDYFFCDDEVYIASLFTYENDALNSLMKSRLEKHELIIPKKEEKHLNTKERKSLHLIIAALVELADYDIEQPYAAAKEIMYKIKESSHIAENTVVTHLKAARKTAINP